MTVEIVISLVKVMKPTIITDGNDIYNNYHGNMSRSDYVRINDSDDDTNKNKDYKNYINSKYIYTLNDSNNAKGEDRNNTGIS